MWISPHGAGLKADQLLFKQTTIDGLTNDVSDKGMASSGRC
jgi:hypothetical protein